ncbi:MAG: histidinol dehydrogenase [Deferribacteraceae bacterium]|jgi:histidinol dehydrogenase|nr:histidinol dehydrogenase [Deferribacteraceae bacterium]
MIIDKFNKKLQSIKRRGEIFEGKYLDTVINILRDVRENGDRAVLSYTSNFDRFECNAEDLLISKQEIESAWESLPQDLKTALITAKERITSFHEKQWERSWTYNDNGVMLGQQITPLERVGVYVPGGKASYPSSVLMNVIPAKVAGVNEVVMVTPTPGGVVNPVVLAAAHLVGVDKVYRIGGAQAVAALAYGTDTIPKVDKIVGPGNIYVALAKKMVFGTVDIDMMAGPSEILVIADESCNPAWVAADMLSQAEHDELASAIAITTSHAVAEKIEAEVERQLAVLPRQQIAEQSIRNFAAIIVVDSLVEACDVANEIAPEHLELCVDSPLELLKYIKHAGAIFLGHYTPEAVGDYFAGPNHVLPTGGSARFFSPLGVYDFIKRSSLIYYDKESLVAHADMISSIAYIEDLRGHSFSALTRKND